MSSEITFEQSFPRRLIPLALTQFLGVFNDHAFKTITVLAVISISGASYSDDAAFLALATIVYVLPYLVFSELAGFLSDRFSKRAVIGFAKLSELLIMLFGTLTLYELSSWGVIPLVGVLFLMASQSAFFSPAFNGILPELFPEKDLSSANGIIGMINFLGVIFGAAAGFLLKASVSYFPEMRIYMCGLIFSLLSLTGLFAALNIIPGRPGDRAHKWKWNIVVKYIEGLKYLFKRRSLFIAMAGESYFYALGSAVQAVVIVLAKYSLEIPGGNAIDIGLIHFSLAVGIGIGCFVAGKISGGKVELGIVPFGAFGMALFLVLAALFPGPSFVVADVIIYPVLMVFLFMLGVSGGLFAIPLRAYQQNNTDPAERGKFFANANIVCFGLILFTGMLMFYLTSGGGSEGVAAGIPGGGRQAMARVQSCCLSLYPVTLMLICAAVTVAVSLVMFFKMRDFIIRSVVFLITHSLYRVRVNGAENIPERGPALLVANHVSFVDAFLIMSCTSRTVRFLMHEDFFRFPFFYPFVKWAGALEVPAAGPKRLTGMFERARELLREGEVVCIFPEGNVTKNGIMREFKRGAERLLPGDIEVPVVPVRLGMVWGSIFSYYYGKVKFRLPKEIPHPASVTIGSPMPPHASPFQMRQIISELAAETEKVPRKNERPLHYQFAKYAKRHPFKKIVVDYDGKTCSNFSMLTRSVILSREIRKIVPENDTYVGVMLPNTHITAISVLAVMMADKVPAMLNFSAPASVILKSCEKAELNCIITSRKFIQKAGIEELPGMLFLEDIAPKISKGTKYIYTLLCALLPRQELMNLIAPVSHRDVFRTAVLLFSSGSSGDPKGVMLSHHNINSDVHSFLRIIGWLGHDAIAGNLPLFHSFGMTTSFWLPLMLGVKVVYIPNPLDGAMVGRAIEEHNLTILLATPTFLQTYMRRCKPEQLKSLRLVVTGAERLRRDIADKFKEMTGLSVVEGYGCTELSPVVSINVSNSILDLGKKAGRRGSVGPPLPGICAGIVDPESGETLPPGREGLLMIKGANVMQGYLKDPEKTSEVIKDGWYNTGDIARLSESGRITITGRLSRFSKIGGEMVPHQLVESAVNEILETEETQIAVAGAPDPGKGEKLIVLYTSLSCTSDDIVKKLREKKLPNLWIPKAENFYKIDKLPLLGSGKLDLQKLNETIKELIPSSGLDNE